MPRKKGAIQKYEEGGEGLEEESEKVQLKRGSTSPGALKK